MKKTAKLAEFFPSARNCETILLTYYDFAVITWEKAEKRLICRLFVISSRCLFKGGGADPGSVGSGFGRIWVFTETYFEKS